LFVGFDEWDNGISTGKILTSHSRRDEMMVGEIRSVQDDD
jgi:hypothetical protein